MLKVPQKAVVIGLDGPIIKSVWKLIQEGELPNLAKLIREGTWAENCLSPHPTITPPGWTTVATGSWPGTHGITDAHTHKAGMPLDETYPAFLSDCQAEYIWQSAERMGKKTILLNYSTTWPPTLRRGIQIAGFAGRSNPDPAKRSLPLWDWLSIADQQLLSTEELPFADILNLKEASGWKGLRLAKKSLEAEVKVGYRNTLDRVIPQSWHLLVQDQHGKGYDVISLARDKEARKILFSLRKGEWSKKVVVEFKTDKGKRRGVFMGKLLELSPDAQHLRLYLTPFCQLEGYSYPDEIAKELEALPGLPFRAQGNPFDLGWIDLQTHLECIELHNTWLGVVAAYLLKNKEWNLFFMHAHCLDYCYHTFINKIDADVCKDKDELTKYQEAEAQLYRSLDKMIGKILDTINREKTLVVVVSDHGITPTKGRFEPDFEFFNVANILEKAGLTIYRDYPKTEERKIDWRKTKAVAQRSVYIYVNLKGRDPQGIVMPGEEYEKVRNEVINALYGYTDPKTGNKPIVFALKKEDARILGLHGNRIGDIVYGIRPEFSGEHGRQISTGEYGVGSMKGLLIMTGPNIKKNYILQRTVWLTDIVPTLSYLLDIPIPREAEGGIIYQALEDPDFKIRELEALKKKLYSCK